MRIVLDTNVLISAALKGGFSEDILNLLSTSGIVILILSEEILVEVSEKLSSKFSWSNEEIKLFSDYLRKISTIVEIEEIPSIIKEDPDDNMILGTALAGKADLIVSSDQDLIALKKFRGIGIVHPKTLTWTFPDIFKKIKN